MPETVPMSDSFLSFLDAQMALHQEQITCADVAQLSRISSLITDAKEVNQLESSLTLHGVLSQQALP
jgi:hypothetical protein